jgi:large subunit ribosomal protein L6
MSRVGKRPIEIPEGTTVEIKGNRVSATGPWGSLSHQLPRLISIKRENGTLMVERARETTEARALHGLTRTLVDNVVQGVSRGFEKKLKIIGVGYRVEQQENVLVFRLGYSHEIIFQQPKGIKFTIEKNTLITVAGADKTLVGQVAANILRGRGGPHQGGQDGHLAS